MRKIQLYLLEQILKSFFLIFFILIGISWLLQATRLLNLITIHKIPFIKVFLLSMNVIPNIISTIIPFIALFGVLLICWKLFKDRELLAAFTLGLSKKIIIQPFIIFTIFIFTISLLLSFFLSPFFYGNFKKNEFDLRTNLDIDNIGLNNFYNFNNEIVINFEKEKDNFVNLLIFQTKPSNNLIFANKSEMKLNKNKLSMKLFNGYKMEIKENSFETLLYDKYNFSINLDNNEVYNDSDTNTYGLLRLLKENNEINYLIINQRIVDSFLLITIIFLIAKYILLSVKFNYLNISYITLICIFIIFLDNILGNLSMKNNIFIILMYANVFIPMIPLPKKKL